MRTSYFATLSAAALVAVVLLAGSVASGSQQIAKTEGMQCTACHDKPGSKLLTDRGKFYEAMGTLEGFDELAASFGRCTSCHVKKPGSLKLTSRGKQFKEMVGDMEGLKEWMAAHHPVATPKGESPPGQ